MTSAKLASGIVKTTEIGCSWVTTTMPFGSFVCTFARVDLTQPDPASYRRDYVAISEIELLRVDLRLIGFYRRLILRDERDLRIAGLVGDRVLRRQSVVAFEIELGILQ